MRTARQSLVVLELPSDDVVVRLISVPAQARDFLADIIRNQIERISPWRPEQVAYGYDAEPSLDDAAALAVRVLLVPLPTVSSACAKLSAVGLTVDRIVSHERNKDSGDAIVIWSRLLNTSKENLARSRKIIVTGIAGFVGFCLVVSVWCAVSAAIVRDARDDVVAQAEQLRRQLDSGRFDQSDAAAGPAQRAWHAKATSPSATILLEVLSRALPDTAYLTDISIQNLNLRISGLVTDAPSLIAPLENSGHFSDVHFFAPTTRVQHNALSTFHIESKIIPRIAIAED
jgi:general secretion pathway protein L